MNRYINDEFLAPRLLKRECNSHKGDYGHLCLVCGCDSMPGAASLATAAALKSGCGLVTLHTSSFAAQISAVSNPSAILSLDPKPYFSQGGKDWSRYDTIAVGPGLGKAPETVSALKSLLESQSDANFQIINANRQMDKANRPMVLDADAINIIAEHPELRELIPSGSILTPHDGELARLISWTDEKDKSEKIQNLADALRCIIVSKGYHSKIYVHESEVVYENVTGNPGMAKGGSGDVLTGLIGGLLARGYDSATAAMLAVWLHGYAGDRCSELNGMDSYSSLDLVGCLHLGFKYLYSGE